MKVSSSYVAVVLIWSTTPLAIQWSNSSLSFVEAISARMVLALLVCVLILKVMRLPLFPAKGAWKVYLFGGFGLFPNMLLVYWAAQYISSGLMSVIMGLYPFCVGLFTWVFFKEKSFNIPKIVAVALAVAGLIIINFGQMQLGIEAVLGVLAMVLVCILWGASSVWIKHLGKDIHPMQQGTGSLIFAAPCFVLSWIFLDGQLPTFIDNRSILGVAYLVLAGSVLGHTLFFYILRHCSVLTVSLVTLIAPVLAMFWGHLLASESFSVQTLVGAGFILFSLALYQGVVTKIFELGRDRGVRSVNSKVHVEVTDDADNSVPLAMQSKVRVIQE